MNVFIAGGTGLLGSAAAQELISRGHRVRSVALPPLPEGAPIPPEMELTLGNLQTFTDEAIAGQLRGCDALVFAAGVDERVEFPAPVSEVYRRCNIEPVERLLRIGRETGLRKAVILGSDFSYFAKCWPEMQLEERHPYIRSRLLQEETALSFNGEGLDVMVLELPYIFGTQPGRKPVWTFLVEIIRNMPGVTLYPPGGTTMVTVRQVAEAVCGALEKGRGGTCYPVGWFNLTWKEMLGHFHRHMGMPKRRILTIPKWVFRLNVRSRMKEMQGRGVEPGLNLVAFADLQTAETFIDPSQIRDELGVTDDDIVKAIGESVRLCLEALDGRAELLGMKTE